MRAGDGTPSGMRPMGPMAWNGVGAHQVHSLLLHSGAGPSWNTASHAIAGNPNSFPNPPRGFDLNELWRKDGAGMDVNILLDHNRALSTDLDNVGAAVNDAAKSLDGTPQVCGFPHYALGNHSRAAGQGGANGQDKGKV